MEVFLKWQPLAKQKQKFEFLKKNSPANPSVIRPLTRKGKKKRDELDTSTLI